VAVAEEGSFTRAASRLHLAQQALSQQIADLERELQVKLFERSGGGAHPTPAGAAFVQDARLTLAQSQLAVARARSRARGESGRLRLGVGRSFRVCDSIVAEALARFHRRYPDVGIGLVPAGTADKLEAILHGTLDLAITHGAPDARGEIEGQVLWEEPLNAVLLPAAHPLARKAPLWLRDLAELPMLALPREADSALLDHILAALAARGLRPKISGIQMAGFLPELAAEFIAQCPAWRLMVGSAGDQFTHLSSVAFRALADEPIPLSWWVLWRHEDASPLVSRFVAVCKEVRQARRRPAEPVRPVNRVG
jgi:DNA-binding transcriptional LysR family regulator